jgi:hypothetical protein
MKPLAKGVSYHVAAASTQEEIEADWRYLEQHLMEPAGKLDGDDDREDYLFVKITGLASKTSAGAPTRRLVALHNAQPAPVAH